MSDDHQMMRIYMDGLIARDVSVGTPIPDDDPYWSTPEGKASREKEAARKKARENDEIRMITLTEGGSIKWLEVTRARARELMEEGWEFDDETAGWASE